MADRRPFGCPDGADFTNANLSLVQTPALPFGTATWSNTTCQNGLVQAPCTFSTG